MPKHCYTCELQGHDEVDCRSLHPELRNIIVEDKQERKMGNKEGQEAAEVHKRFNNGRVVYAK